jgi:hypothetical protein
VNVDRDVQHRLDGRGVRWYDWRYHEAYAGPLGVASLLEAVRGD